MRTRIGYLLPFCFLLFLTKGAESQLYNYFDYNTSSGLAGNTVHCIFQDSKGFIWMGTETGLSRFDGTAFRNFTTEDGLPDNEVLQMFEDSRQRLWMLPFQNDISFIEKGRICNRNNDTLLRKMNFTGRPLNILEDGMGTIWIAERNGIFRVFLDGRVEYIQSLAGVPLKPIISMQGDAETGIWFVFDEGMMSSFYCFDRENMVEKYRLPVVAYQNEILFGDQIRFFRFDRDRYIVESEKFGTRDTISLYVFGYLITVTQVNDSILGLNSPRGTYLYNLKQSRIDKILFGGKAINRVIQDREGCIWAATAAEGVFQLNSDLFQNLSNFSQFTSAYSFLRYNNRLFVGTNSYQIKQYVFPKLQEERTFTPKPNWVQYNITGIERINSGYLLIANHGIYQVNDQFELTKEITSLFPKSYVRLDDHLLVATTSNVIKLDPQKLKIDSVIWNGRATSVYTANGTIYLGTLSGLHELNEKGEDFFWGTIDPLLKNRISAIVGSLDGTIWVATYGNGLIQVRNRKVINRVHTSNGLSSNICRCMYMSDGFLWVGTDKGLNRIDTRNGNRVIRISREDGLNSDLINNIQIWNDTVFVATSKGVTFFPQKGLSNYSECRLVLLEVVSNNKVLPESPVYLLNTRELKVSFVGISFKSAGEINYQYRLTNENGAEWSETQANTLEFLSLPYGEYQLEIRAINKFGVESQPLFLTINVPRPFWRNPLFQVGVLLLLSTLAFLIFRQRLRNIRKVEVEKTTFNKKIAEMEMKALRAQMNPHFTFNVLNSIQYFIGFNDMHSAQRYLSRFSKLIRRVLDNSEKTFVTIEEEVQLLDLYLDLERMRFNERFNFQIEVDENLKIDQLLIPNMMIQPLVENSVKHGFREGVKNPEIRLRFSAMEEKIRFELTDNGIGRKRSEEIRRMGEPIHRSSGTNLIREKVDVLVNYYNYQVQFDIQDITRSDGQPAGTSVVLVFPQKWKEYDSGSHH